MDRGPTEYSRLQSVLGYRVRQFTRPQIHPRHTTRLWLGELYDAVVGKGARSQTGLLSAATKKFRLCSCPVGGSIHRPGHSAELPQGQARSATCYRRHQIGAPASRYTGTTAILPG